MSDSKFTLSSLRQAYFDFFVKNAHSLVPSVNLVPENDPTTLFTSAGMQPMIAYFFGAKHPEGRRIVNSQKCFRSEDIEEVGDNRHTTFFEMLGNWSLGDYFKREQIEFFFKFLVEELGLNPQKIYVSVFAGNSDLGIPRDDEAAAIWQNLFASHGVEAKIITNPELGLQGGRIFFYPEKKNWWSRSGVPAQMPIGEPGGPDSEVFYDFGESYQGKNLHLDSPFAAEPCHINCDCGRFMEIGNSVFMQYQKTAAGFEELEQKNIDFGGGLERILAALENQPDVFQTNAFSELIASLEKLSAYSYQELEKRFYFRVIADHLRAAVFLIADGVMPSNKEQGYLLRRLIRRSLRQANYLKIEGEFLAKLVPVVTNFYADHYPELAKQQQQIAQILATEEKKFARTLLKGLSEFEKIVAGREILTAATIFKLYESYGFPFELSIEEAKARHLKIEEQVDQKLQALKAAHSAKSRLGSAAKFKGGLADQSELTTAFHTSTHLLQAALRKVLGEQIAQKGSNITPERLRFDFAHPQALTAEQKVAVEQLINQWIAADLPVRSETMPKAAALESGAVAFFAERYPETVTVYTIGEGDDWVSKELCGGPHIQKTGDLAQFGNFVIFKEKAVSAGVRRIYAQFSKK